MRLDEKVRADVREHAKMREKVSRKCARRHTNSKRMRKMACTTAKYVKRHTALQECVTRHAI